jgi:hypothetical protein
MGYTYLNELFSSLNCFSVLFIKFNNIFVDFCKSINIFIKCLHYKTMQFSFYYIRTIIFSPWSNYYQITNLLLCIYSDMNYNLFKEGIPWQWVILTMDLQINLKNLKNRKNLIEYVFLLIDSWWLKFYIILLLFVSSLKIIKMLYTLQQLTVFDRLSNNNKIWL